MSLEQRSEELKLHDTGAPAAPDTGAPAEPDTSAPAEPGTAAPSGQGARPRRWPGSMRALRFSNFSALYVGAGLFALFSLWVPDTFLRTSTFTTILSEQAITGIVAVGLVLPFAAGAFDLSFAYNVGFGSILVAWMIGDHGFPVWAAVVLAVAACTAIGAINGALVTVVGINSVIATLGVGSCLSAATNWVSGGNQIIGLSNAFQSIADDSLLGISLPVYYLLALALIAWFALEHNPWGRRVYAVGGNREAARLAGIRADRIVFTTLTLVGAAAGFAGVLVSAQIGAGDPSVGPPYLLPAFAGVFLGSTQIHRGRFNVWGTVVAVLVLAMGVKGLQLAGAPFWLPDMFNGVALIVAVGISQGEHVRQFLARLRRLRAPD
ncbi:MAG TPA: ABC transporter permease [Solirubrobacteraceae bacterium]|nr:ABC transporter permease [Solirubrobacteraceae bacterium]